MKFQVVLNLITSSCNLISSWLCSLPSVFPLQNPPAEVTSQNRISHTKENSARLGGSIPSLPAHSNTQGLGTEGEPGRIQVSISTMESTLVGVYPPPTSAPGGPIMSIKSSGQKAQQTFPSEEQARIALWMETSDRQPLWKQMEREERCLTGPVYCLQSR